jgi:hypothetical protein
MLILLTDVHLAPESDCTRVHSKLPNEKEGEVIKKRKGRRRRSGEEGKESCLPNNSCLTNTNTFMLLHMCVYIYMYIYTCIYIYTYIYILVERAAKKCCLTKNSS